MLSIANSKNGKRFVVVKTYYDAIGDCVCNTPVTGYFKTYDKAEKRMNDLEVEYHSSRGIHNRNLNMLCNWAARKCGSYEIQK